MIPWLLSIGMAIWFAVMAHRAHRRWFLWALGGALSSLVISTIVLGLCDAVFIPMSHKAYVIFRIESVALAVLAVVCFVGLPAVIAHRIRGAGKKAPERP